MTPSDLGSARSMFKVELEERHLIDGIVDADALITAFPTVWVDFLGDDEPDDEAKREFIEDSIAEMGADDFMDGEWVTQRTDDRDGDTTVMRVQE